MRRFCSTAQNTGPRMTSPAPLPGPLIRPNPRINKETVFRSSPVTKKPRVPWQELPHIRGDRLPEKATDIKGIDTAGHLFFSRRALFGKIPMLLSCKYFSAVFVPQSHVICSLRKSNVAYTFTNYGCPNLNDVNLQKSFVGYRGKYKSMEFFKTVHSPMGTAVARSTFRKLIKRALYRALHETVPNTPSESNKISGIFHFRFHRYPVAGERKNLRSDVKTAVEKLYTNEALRRSLDTISRQQNKAYPSVRMLAKDIKVENTLGATSMPGYYPKLPFLPSDFHTPRKR